MTTSPLRSSNEISRVDLGLSVAGRILEATPANIVRAVQAMREGGIIVSPTVTNYCLLCDATNPEAVEKVFAAKKRVKLGPLPVQIADPARIREYVILPEGKRRQAVEAMLPGEICFILPQLYPFCERLTCGLGTIAISSIRFSARCWRNSKGRSPPPAPIFPVRGISMSAWKRPLMTLANRWMPISMTARPQPGRPPAAVP